MSVHELKPKVDEDLVAMCERLLGWAKSGEIRGLVYGVEWSANNEVTTDHHLGDRIMVSGMMEYMKHMMFAAMREQRR